MSETENLYVYNMHGIAEVFVDIEADAPGQAFCNLVVGLNLQHADKQRICRRRDVVVTTVAISDGSSLHNKMFTTFQY